MGRNATLEVVLDCFDPEKLMGFWREALGYRVHYSEPSLAVLLPQDVNTSPLLLQRVPEPKAGKNRMHLDIVTEDVETDMLITSAQRRLPASSNEVRVRVESSKNRLMRVRPRNRSRCALPERLSRT